jgi:fructan beta-fructosidase
VRDALKLGLQRRSPATALLLVLALAASVLAIAPADAQVAATGGGELSTEIENPGFETGDLSGWEVVSGDAFGDESVTDAESYWGGPFRHEGTYHLWGALNDGDNRTGVLKSSHFELAGTGQIDFLIGGGQDPDHLYVALVRASDDTELLREYNRWFDDSEGESYHRAGWDASDYLGEELYIKVVNGRTGGWGHINVDDFRVHHTDRGLPNEIENPGFETGDLSGWEVVSGDAFGDESVTDAESYWGGPFRHEGTYHLWGALNDGDNRTGVLKSSHFELAGTGQIDFLIGGGQDPDHLYVALVRASDDTELLREYNRWFDDSEGESYHRAGWDASDYLGEELYIKVVNGRTGGWGHINVDDFRVLNRGEIAHWRFDEGEGAVANDEVTGAADEINYVFNDARWKESSDPLWREGIAGSALLFDGYSTWLSRDAADVASPRDELTIEAWVAPRAYEWGQGGKLSAIVNQHDRSARSGYLLGMGRHGAWSFQVGFGDAWVEVWADEDARLPVDTWSHIVATFDRGDRQLRLFLNGDLVGSAATPIGGSIQPANQPLQVGRHNDATWVNGVFSANMWPGLLDELRLSSAALSTDEVTDRYAEWQGTLGGDDAVSADTAMDRGRYDGDRHRPQYHLTAPEHWMNEPHAPLYFEGKYHIFYQYNPTGPYWGQIHWGHAVSDDMVHWEDAPVAIRPEAGSVAPDGVWSGDSVIDDHGNPVLFFTAGDDRANPNQRTGLARSTFPQDGDPRLHDWELHDEPVTVQDPDLHADEGDVYFGQFRDPFVFKEGDTWYQLVTSGIVNYGDDGGVEEHVGGTALVYTSTDPDLEEWEYQGPLMVGDYASYPATGHVWELPVLLPLPDERGNPTDKWAFFINPWFDGFSPDDVKYVFYWVGEFDTEEHRFVPDHDEPRMFDYGEHFTGPSGFVDDDGRSILWSIAQDRRSEQEHYDAGWAHNAGLPLSLTLDRDGDLGIEPIEELAGLRQRELARLRAGTIEKANAALASVEGDTLEVELDLVVGNADRVGLGLRRTPDGEEETLLAYDVAEQQLSIDRNASSLDADARKGVHGGPLALDGRHLRLRVFLDRSMVEAYANGSRSITSRVYPSRADALGLRVWSEGGTAVVRNLKVWELGSAYGELVPPHQTSRDPVMPEAPLANHEFQDGDLGEWIVVDGNAFTDDHVTTRDDWGWGGPFYQAHAPWVDGAHHHLWGIHPDHGGDAATGEMRSATFTLGGDGQIDFLVGGGRDHERLFVALVRADDDAELMRVTGHDTEQYRRVFWDASDHLGERLYLRVVDRATGGWGHINIDSVHVPTAPATAAP